MPTVKSKTDKVSRKVKLALSRKRAIARQNRIFEKLPVAEQRVQIAQDVLAQIKLEKFIPETGTWLNSNSGNLFSEKDLTSNKEIRDVLNKTETCTGCALGGLFMCAIKRADDLKVCDLGYVKDVKKDLAKDEKLTDKIYYDELGADLHDILKYMKRWFSRSQLRLIELAFEDGTGGIEPQTDKEYLATDFFYDENSGERLGDASEKMRLIMENIVDNKGTFDITKKPIRKVTVSWHTSAAAA